MDPPLTRAILRFTACNWLAADDLLKVPCIAAVVHTIQIGVLRKRFLLVRLKSQPSGVKSMSNRSAPFGLLDPHRVAHGEDLRHPCHLNRYDR